MGMTGLMLGAALIAQALPATDSVRWEEVLPADNSGRNFIDPASLRRDGDRVRFLMRSVGHQTNADGVAAFNMRVEIDCRARTFTLLVADSYTPDGTLVASVELPPDQLQPTPVGEINDQDRLLPRVCGAGAA